MQQTDWVVITGAPCSGKTAVIRELERRGCRVIHEAARAFIEAGLDEGATVEQIRADAHAFEHRILARKAAAEASLPVDRRIYFDRGIPDSIAYFQSAGLDPAAPLKASRIRRYRKIFLMARLEWTNDAVRAESDAEAVRLERLITAGYRKLGYAIVRVPILSVPRRADFILDDNYR